VADILVRHFFALPFFLLFCNRLACSTLWIFGSLFSHYTNAAVEVCCQLLALAEADGRSPIDAVIKVELADGTDGVSHGLMVCGAALGLLRVLSGDAVLRRTVGIQQYLHGFLRTQTQMSLRLQVGQIFPFAAQSCAIADVVRSVDKQILLWGAAAQLATDPSTAIEHMDTMRVLTLPRSLQTPLAALLPAERLNPSRFSQVLTVFRWHAAPRSLPDNAAPMDPTFLWSLLPQFAFDPVTRITLTTLITLITPITLITLITLKGAVGRRRECRSKNTDAFARMPGEAPWHVFLC
jgi:hypothetical protein